MEFQETLDMLGVTEEEPGEDPLVITPPKPQTPSLIMKPVQPLMNDNLTNGFDKDKSANSELEECFTFTYSENVCNSTNQNAWDKGLPQATLKTFICKSCKQPYELIRRGNLIIRGFCPRCLGGSEEINSEFKIPIKDEETNSHVSSKMSFVACEYCNKSFRFNKALTEHKKSRDSKKHSCSVCNELFCNSNDLKVHCETKHEKLESSFKEDSTKKINDLLNLKINSKYETIDMKDEMKLVIKRQHTVKKYKRCNLCRISLPLAKFSQHMANHKRENVRITRRSSCDKLKKVEKNDEQTTKESFKLCKYNYLCRLCIENFENLDLLNLHLSSDKHANNIVLITGISLSCKQCNQLFQSINDFKLHLTEMCHIAAHHTDLTNITVYRCDSCNIGFIDKADYNIHKNFNHKENERLVVPMVKVSKQDHDENGMNEQEIREKVKNSKFYECETCNEIFKSVSSLRKHGTRRGHKIGDFAKQIETDPPIEEKLCQICNKSVSDLKTHLKTCGKLVKSDGASDKAQFGCQTCTKVFNSEGDSVYHKLLERHEVVENHLKINCTDCSKFFVGLAAFSRHAKRECHVESHVQKVISNSFCNVCECNVESGSNHVRLDTHIAGYGRILFETSNIVSELRNESRNRVMKKAKRSKKIFYKCKICKKRFQTKLNLRMHSRFHVGYNPRLATCNICKRVFDNMNNLNRHMKNLHLPHEYACNKCKRSFPYRYLLKLHSMRKCL